ncbi:hypothetical protein OWR28_01145 [Chryseobacterium sp. 1B4]
MGAQKTNLAPSVPATDHYFGTKIIDDYRNLENLKDSATAQWMKSQTDYTNFLINKIPNRDYYLKKRLEFDKRQGYSVSDFVITNNDRYFYLKKVLKRKLQKFTIEMGLTERNNYYTTRIDSYPLLKIPRINLNINF